jgi:hypothetical protein
MEELEWRKGFVTCLTRRPRRGRLIQMMIVSECPTVNGRRNKRPERLI